MIVLVTSTVCEEVPDHAVGGERHLVGAQFWLPGVKPARFHRGDLAGDGVGASPDGATEPLLDLVVQGIQRQRGIPSSA